MSARASGDGTTSSARAFEPRSIRIHDHEMVYRVVGQGPPVVLIHGMINTSRHWERVALGLSDRHTVIAPDLLGHGDSAAVRGDYSLGAHAASIRDLLAAIGIERATIIGHSLGGGVAMIFFYQFPERTERLGLVSSGGLGHDVSPLLRGVAVPGAAPLLWAASRQTAIGSLERAGDALRERGSRKAVYLDAIARALRPLRDAGSRRAFLRTLRAVIDMRGQAVSARDRLYLVADFPVLIVWGERDRTIPIEHGRVAHEMIPGSRFQTLPGAAHFPHIEDPEGLIAALRGWLSTSEPALIADGDWGALVRREGQGDEGAPTTAASAPTGSAGA